MLRLRVLSIENKLGSDECYMEKNERIIEITPGAYSRIQERVAIIWSMIHTLSDNSYNADEQSIVEELEAFEFWCEYHIGYGCVGVFSILEITDKCKSRIEETINVSAFRREFCYELELLAFVVCAYFGMDYREICMSLKIHTSFEYNPCLIYKGPDWISEERCYEESVKMLQNYRENYEQQIIDELSRYVEKKKVVRKRNHGRFNQFSISIERQRLNRGTKRYNEAIKDRIQNSDSFNEYHVDLDFLCGHQKAGCLLASKYDRFAFFYDTGTGKTIMSLAIMYEKQRDYHSSFLILAPLAIIENAWIEDAKNYFPGMRIMPLCSRYKQQDYKNLYDTWKKNGDIPERFLISQYEWETFFRKNEREFRNTVAYIKLLSMSDHYIVNIEMFRRNPEDYLIQKVDGLIVDESALLKNPYTESARAVDEYSDEYKYIYLLSGKPAPNNSFEYYMQMRIVDPENFDMSPDVFKSTFFVAGRDSIVFRNSEYEAIAAEMIAQRSLIVSKEDCLKLKPQYEEVVPVTLDPISMKRYGDVMNGCFKKIAEMDRDNRNRFLSTSRRLATITKLREVTSGFLIDDNKECQTIHRKKEMALLELINNYPGEQFVIWCSFVYEIERLMRILSRYGIAVSAYGKTRKLQDNIYEFKQGRARFLIAHPKTLKYGVTLVNCQRAVYYSLSYSAEDYYQSHDRIYRMGQQSSCYFYFLIAKDTIDETVYECVKNKMNSADTFLQIVKHASEHGVKYTANTSVETIMDIQKAKNEAENVRSSYNFAISGDCSFAYQYDGEEYNSILFNTNLARKNMLYAEEILFEIGRDVLFGETIDISYRQVEIVIDWVEKKMKLHGITMNQRIYEYFDEQKEKRYEMDIAQGLAVDDDDFIS